jgi:hypothetical protein
MEEWKDGRVEGGRVEGWKGGRVEKWKDGRDGLRAVPFFSFSWSQMIQRVEGSFPFTVGS